jgi:hypothetical protein
MLNHIKKGIFSVACGAFLLGAPLEASAAPNLYIPQGVAGPVSFVQQSHYHGPHKTCLKWTRRWNTRHGVGHRRCVHWVSH